MSEGTLEAQLMDVMPGLRLLDRDVQLGGLTIERVGRAIDGRLVLFQFADEVDANVVAGVLDLCHAAEEHGDLLARHMGTPAEASLPLVVLVASSLDERAFKRLAAVDPARMRVLEVKEIRSSRATSTFLVARGEERPGFEAPALDERLAALEGATRRRVELFVSRLSRIDRELEVRTTEEGIDWRMSAGELCRMRIEGDQAFVSLPGREARELAEDEDVELLLDSVVSGWLELAELEMPPGMPAGMPRVV